MNRRDLLLGGFVAAFSPSLPVVSAATGLYGFGGGGAVFLNLTQSRHSAADVAEIVRAVADAAAVRADTVEPSAKGIALILNVHAELLDALQSAVAAMHGLGHPDGWGALAKAEAAIAKATGAA